MGHQHRFTDRECIPLELRSRGQPRTSPGTGRATRIEGLVPDLPTAVRRVRSNDTEPESSNSGQGSPVRTRGLRVVGGHRMHWCPLG